MQKILDLQKVELDENISTRDGIFLTFTPFKDKE